MVIVMPSIVSLDLLGHSSFELELVSTSDGHFVRKSAKGDTGSRLKLQKRKQEKFYEELNKNDLLNNIFKVPRIITEKNKAKDDEYSFLMEYIGGQNLLEIIRTKDPSWLKSLLDRIIIFLDWELSQCETKTLDIQILLDKVDSTYNKTKENDLEGKFSKQTDIVFNLFKKKVSKIEKEPVPVGFCHGDLTFSNIIISDYSIVLIDFLDSYVETPLQDIAKMSQELSLAWSLLMAPEVRDRVKVNIAYDFMRGYWNSILEEFLEKQSFSKDLTELFYLLTLLRILPYTKRSQIYEKILTEIHRKL